MKTVQDIMTKNVITVLPNTPLLDVAHLLSEHKFDGVPVVDIDKTLLGVINEYDLLRKGSAVHLPTLQTVMQNISMVDKEHAKMEEEYNKIFKLTAAEIMNSDPLYLGATATLEETIQLFLDHHRVNPVPVVDEKKRVIGIVSRYDVLKVFGMLKSQ